MIQLQAVPRPVKLSDELITQLSEEYSQTQKNVWAIDDIKKGLLSMSHGKCCYCECSIVEESKYLEVEHFIPKKHRPDLVITWENLLPACKRCNGHKRDWNTEENPIIHPVRDNPKEHLYLNNYSFRHKTVLGKTTIDVVYLNDTLRVVTCRFEVGVQIQASLEELESILEDYIEGRNTTEKRRNELTRKLYNILIEGTPQKSYAATAATVILTDPIYAAIRENFKKIGIWDSRFEDLETQLTAISLV